ncbi:hypothetical protein [Nocardia sp. NPDC004604]|uniref:hypothetical protein n=1 Tax=Nocardia sp. NPDC004604 TaxID=3157013 RepID=UPI0033A647F8
MLAAVRPESGPGHDRDAVFFEQLPGDLVGWPELFGVGEVQVERPVWLTGGQQILLRDRKISDRNCPFAN